MTFSLFAAYFSIYFAVAFLVGFLWQLLDIRLDNGYVRNSDVTEAFVFALPACLWVPVRVVVSVLQLARWVIVSIFNIGVK